VNLKIKKINFHKEKQIVSMFLCLLNLTVIKGFMLVIIKNFVANYKQVDLLSVVGILMTKLATFVECKQ
jgi:hypothetical protein